MAVVVAVDLSIASERAAAVAGQLALRLGEQLTVLHVAWPPPPALDEAATELSALAQVQSRTSIATLEALRQRLCGKGVRVSTQVVFGKPKDQLVEYVTKHPTSILVLGPSRPTSGARRLLTRGVSEGVIQGAPCPVMVMPALPPSLPSAPTGEHTLMH